MSPGDLPPPREVAYRFHPREPGWTHPFLGRLAEALCVHPTGEAVLIERVGDAVPTIVPSTPSVALAIRSASEGLPGRLEPVGPLPASPAVARGPGRFLLLVPGVAPSEEGPYDGEADGAIPRGAERPGLRPSPLSTLFPEEPTHAATPGPGSAFQCHWWSTGSARLAVRVRLHVSGEGRDVAGAASGAAATVVRPLVEAGYTVGFRTLRASYLRRRAWLRGAVRGLSEGRPFLLSPESAARTASSPPPAIGLDEPLLDRHAVVVGASGSGKSSFLAELARRRISGGRPTVVFDVHGDLGPAIVAGLPEEALGRVLGIDAGRPLGEIPGVPLFSGSSEEERERESSHLVASFRHLSSEGAETYWGHRLEQVFDVFVRLVEEEGGGFGDLFELLTDPSRRDAARFTTRRHAAARFLDELPALLRRNPEYLQPAVARVQKVALQPKLERLFDPAERALPVSEWLSEDRSIIWRVPSSEVGPLGSRFATTLLASRVYLGLAASHPPGSGLRVLLVFDEAQALAPSLLTEILSEGRKFGVGAVIATQYAGRLAPEALGAAVGAAGTHLAFRVPRSGAAASGQWVGLHPSEAEQLLPALPTGVAVLDAPPPYASRRLISVPPMPERTAPSWGAVVGRTAQMFGPGPCEGSEGGSCEDVDERILLALVGLDERGVPALPEAIVRSTAGGPGALRPTDLELRAPVLVRRGWVDDSDGRFSITTAGAQRLGMGAPSGASRESEEHRALLIEAFRIFARHGERMEFVRQGRFDTRLPDGRVSLFPPDLGRRTPLAIARAVEHRRPTWAWRAFGGRDIHVEAEVWGAERPERIRRGLGKARDRGASVVFLVGDARRALRVRSVLESAAARPPEAQVWTLRRAASFGRKPDEPDRRSRSPGGPG
jgi:DNA helicase HerA-like ATPase